VAAAPAQAQRASLADRVAALEQQAANNQGNVDLLNQVGALKSEVAALRAQLEELQHQNEQLTQANRSQYLDLDGRLNRLEGGAAPAVAPSSPIQPATPAKDTGKTSEGKPAVYGDAGTLAKDADERSSYTAAFDTLKAGHYADSARQFQDFLQRYPDGAYAPNALYWLGESFYVTQNFTLAQQQFQALLDRYPTHDKAAGALLKVGPVAIRAQAVRCRAGDAGAGRPAVPGHGRGTYGRRPLARDAVAGRPLGREPRRDAAVR
jgi:tol-pal system protein YbgF